MPHKNMNFLGKVNDIFFLSRKMQFYLIRMKLYANMEQKLNVEKQEKGPFFTSVFKIKVFFSDRRLYLQTPLFKIVK